MTLNRMNTSFILRNFLCFPQEALESDLCMLIENGYISKLAREGQAGFDASLPAYDLNGALLVPGFIDLQVNGGNKVFFTQDISEVCLQRIYQDHLAFGTTGMLPTLVTTSFSNMMQSLDVVRSYMSAHLNGVLGLHLEGPYIQKEKKGAHNSKHIRLPQDAELKEIAKSGEGIVKMMTIAPELFNQYQIDMLLEAGIVLSAGHSTATVGQAVDSFSRGVQCVTHLYNAMSGFQSREPGLAGAALNSEDAYASIIVDGLHCHYTSADIACKLKKGKLFLISDASFLGRESLDMDGVHYTFTGDRYVTAEGNLAGSNITMYDAFKNCLKNLSVSLPEAIAMSSLIPAELMRLNNRGLIKEGFLADLNVLNPQNLSLQRVISNGEFYEAKSRV